jgi:DNA-binding transcriptional ArsR family regulator
MASAFPHQPAVKHTPRRQTNVVIDGDEQTDILQAISSETAREIMGTLKTEPGTASDIADTVEMSVQNVSYHLDRLCEAGLITPVETWYSKKGREMTVYALAAEQLVVRFGASSQTENEP